jgi:hypothetical protein
MKSKELFNNTANDDFKCQSVANPRQSSLGADSRLGRFQEKSLQKFQSVPAVNQVWEPIRGRLGRFAASKRKNRQTE